MQACAAAQRVLPETAGPSVFEKEAGVLGVVYPYALLASGRA